MSTNLHFGKKESSLFWLDSWFVQQSSGSRHGRGHYDLSGYYLTPQKIETDGHMTELALHVLHSGIQCWGGGGVPVLIPMRRKVLLAPIFATGASARAHFVDCVGANISSLPTGSVPR